MDKPIIEIIGDFIIKKEEVVKKVIIAVMILMMGAGLAIASDSGCASDADKDPTCVTPVVKAAADVTTGAVEGVTDVATGVMGRRQARREAVKEAILGKGEETSEKAASK